MTIGVPAILEAPRLDRALILKPDGTPSWRYALEPFQRAVAASDRTIADIEESAGFTRGQLSRVIGTQVYPSGSRHCRRWTRARTLSYANAVRIARELNLDFVELGL